MKLLHSADWHLDAPLTLHTPENREWLRRELLSIPGKVAAAAVREGCDLMLLSGDLFDGTYTRESFAAVYQALKDVPMPVCIAPGNHDFYSEKSPYYLEKFPENVYIFSKNAMESVVFSNLQCRVYGSGFTAPCSQSLLEDFHAQGQEKWAVGVLHGDPTQIGSPYNPVTARQVMESGLDYLGLGHLHKAGSLRSGNTLCAWPGCPMGRGFDETEEKGVLIVTLDQQAQARFLPLDTPRFFDWTLRVEGSAERTLSQRLSAAGNSHFYRVTLTGESESFDTAALERSFSQFPNLTVVDKTVPPVDLWASVGTDTLEGLYFAMLRDAMNQSPDPHIAQLAAKLSRQILDGQEVVL